MEWDGSVAVVTGGASGIGRALAGALVARGARVAIADIDGTGAERAAAELGDAALAVPGDAAGEPGIEHLIETATAELGPIDLFCANAGIATGGGLDVDEAYWGAALEVNLFAHIRAARLLVPVWTAREEGGAFLVTASAAGLLSQMADAPYAVTKHAAVGFAEWLAITHGGAGVRVSCLCPMGVETPLLRAGLDAGHAGARSVEHAGKILPPEEVAEVALDAVAAERFLILPHPEVLGMYQGKGSDYDGWIAAMRHFQSQVR